MARWNEIIYSGSNANLNQVTASAFKGDGSAITGVISSSYATTASYVNGMWQAVHSQSVSAATWSFQHNLGQRYPVVTAWSDTHYVIIPTEIFSIDTNQIELRFSKAIAGYAAATVGNVVPQNAQTASYAITASYALNGGGGGPESDPIFVGKSGSLATTGSNTFIGNQKTVGDVVITGSLTVSGSSTFRNIGRAEFTGSFFMSGSGTSAPEMRITGSIGVSNYVYAHSLSSTGGKPTVVSDDDARMSCSIDYGTDSAFRLGIYVYDTAGVGIADSKICTITFNTGFNSEPIIIGITPASLEAAIVQGADKDFNSGPIFVKDHLKDYITIYQAMDRIYISAGVKLLFNITAQACANI